MQTLITAIEDAEVKQRIRNRLHLIDRSNKPEILLREIFAHVPTPTCVQPLLASIDFAAESSAHFNVWFDAVVERACSELFNPYGGLKAGVLLIFDHNNIWSTLQSFSAEEELYQSLLYAFCKNFIGDSAALKNAALGLQRWWAKKLPQVLNVDSVATFVERYSEREWQRLCELWRWIHYFAKHIYLDPLRFCHLIEYSYYASEHYLACFDDLPLDADKIENINECIFQHIGLVALDKGQATLIASLQKTFRYLMKNGSSQEHLSPLFVKHKFLRDICQRQALMLAQFFIVGVHFNSADAKTNVDFMLQEYDIHPGAIEFIKTKVQRYFYRDYATDDERRFCKGVKQAFNDYDAVMSHKPPLAKRIFAMLEMRQILLHWLKGHAGVASLTPWAARGLALLADIDQQMAYWTGVLQRAQLAVNDQSQPVFELFSAQNTQELGRLGMGNPLGEVVA